MDEKKLPICWRRTTRTVLSLALAFLLSACGGGGDGGFVDPGGPGVGGEGYIWILNLVSDSPTLALQVDGDTVALANYAGSTERLTYPTGLRRVTFQQTVQPGNRLVDLPISTDVNLAGNEDAVVVLYGTMDNLQLDVWENDASASADGTGRTDLLNYSSRRPDVDMYLTQGSDTPQTAEPVATAAAPDFDGFYFVNAGRYTLQFTDAGRSEVIYNAGSVELMEDDSHYYVVTDYFGADPEAFIVLAIEGESARAPLVLNYPFYELRFINGIPDYPAVDLYTGDLSGQPAIANVPFTVRSSYQTIESVPVPLTVTAAGDKSTIFYESSAGSPGFQETLVVSGSSTLANTQGQLTLDALRPIDGVSQMTFVHASASNRAIDIYLLDQGESITDRQPIVGGLDYRDPAETYAAVPGNYDLVITLRGNQNALVDPLEVTLRSGQIVSYYLFDSTGGGGPGRLEEYIYLPPPP